MLLEERRAIWEYVKTALESALTEGMKEDMMLERDKLSDWGRERWEGNDRFLKAASGSAPCIDMTIAVCCPAASWNVE